MPSNKVIYCENSTDAIEQLPKFIQLGDVVLIKGSRAMQMENIVQHLKEMM